jgi:hypothetical protein
MLPFVHQKPEYLERLGVSDAKRYSSIQAHPFFNEIKWETLSEQDAPLILPYLPSTTAGPALRSQVRT